MVHFSDTMTRLRRSEYADKYIDYQALRRQLGELKDVYDREAAAAPGKEDNQAVSHPRNRETRREDIERAATDKGPRRSTKHLSPMEYLRKSLSVERFDLEENIEIVELEEHFTHSLGAQVGNVLSFFQQQVEDLENELLAIHRQSEETPATGTSLRDPDLRRTDVRGQLETLGNKVLHLIQYLHVNVATLEKLLGQHDEQVRQRHVPKFCASAQALAKFESMRDLCGNKRFLSLVDGLRTATTSMEGKGGDGMDAGDSDDELDDLQTELDLNLARRNVEDGIHRGTSGSRIYPLTRSPGVRGLLGAIAEEQETLTAAEGHTVTNFLSLEVLPTPRMCTFEDEEFPDHRTLELHQANVLIALATSFMDMVNYYIAEPASSRYASALGASPAASGIIIGMTPLAGCLSCLLFSWWTNTSFKNPLLLCISLLVVGNLLYGLAITFDAYWMVLLGRILIGFGGTRSVCRRYIAGNIPANARTGYSAAFVASGSLGMAFGPVFAILAERIVLNVGALEFNGLTNPGWFMSLGWLSLGLLVIFMFKDPHRKSRSDLHTLMLCKRPTERDAWEDSAEVAPGGVETPDVLGGSWPDDAQPSVRFGALDSYGTIESKPGRFECLQHVWGVADLDASRKRSPGRRPGDPSGSGRKDRDEERWGLLRMPMANARNTKATGTVNVWPRAPPSPSSSERTDSSSEDEEGSTCGEGYVAQSAPTPPLLFCLFGSFVNKLVYEVTVSSAPLLTGYMFGWSMAHVGTMMAALGLMVLPVNVLVARLSLIVEDRLLLQILSSLAGLGCVLIISSPAIPLELKEMQYILGVWLICAALQAHEGVSMSITSKITPIHLASCQAAISSVVITATLHPLCRARYSAVYGLWSTRSTYNPGLLSTGLGTFGRLLGDLTISFGGFVSLQWLDVFLFTPAASLITVMAIGCWIVFPYLRV